VSCNVDHQTNDDTTALQLPEHHRQDDTRVVVWRIWPTCIRRCVSFTVTWRVPTCR
jgi:uncharacterized protein YeaO (DUF488 family)